MRPVQGEGSGGARRVLDLRGVGADRHADERRLGLPCVRTYQRGGGVMSDFWALVGALVVAAAVVWWLETSQGSLPPLELTADFMDDEEEGR